LNYLLKNQDKLFCCFSDRIDEENNKLERIILMKPGFTRLNLSYFASDEEIDYILNAIEFLAYHAWKFLPLV